MMVKVSWPVTLTIIFMSTAVVVPLDKCPFSGRVYFVGDTWHPQLETRGASVCATCSCHAGGKVNCTSKECIPETCPDPRRDPAQCCASCVEVQLEIVDMDSSNGKYFSCLHNGKIYRDGQMFVTNASAELIPSLPGHQCLQCSCKNGSISCDIAKCAPLTCPQKVQMPSSCCPVCDGERVNCHSGDQLYVHGVTWYLPLGLSRMGCEECKCVYGQIECVPLRCPAGRRSCSELRQMKIPDTCCPVCPRNRNRNKFGRGNGNKEKENKERHKSSESVNQSSSACLLPRRSNILVFRNQANSNISGYCQFLFIFTNNETPAELHSWTLRQGRIDDFKTQHLSREEINVLRRTFRFQLIGATNPRLLQKFAAREKKLKIKCVNRCSKKVFRLSRALRLKEVTNGKHCANFQLHV